MNDTRNPRLLVKGDRIIPKGLRHAEVVRSISVVVHASNGADYVYEADEEVRLAPDEELAPSEIELQEAIQREAENEARQEAAEAQLREAAKRDAEELIRREQAAMKEGVPPEDDISEEAAPAEG